MPFATITPTFASAATPTTHSSTTPASHAQTHSTLQAETAAPASTAPKDAPHAMPPSASPASPIINLAMVAALHAQVGPIRREAPAIASLVRTIALPVRMIQLKSKRFAQTVQPTMEYQMDHVKNVILGNIRTEAILLVFPVQTAAWSVLAHSIALRPPAAAATLTSDIQTEHALPVLMVKHPPADNLFAVLWAAPPATAPNAPAARQTTTSPSTVAYNAQTALTQKQELQLLVPIAPWVAWSVIALPV